MSQKSRVVLKTKFEAGRTPAEKDFADLLDSGINKIDDQIGVRKTGEGNNTARYIGIGSVDPDSPLSIRNRSGGHNLLGFEDHEGNEKWQVEIDPENADEGLNIKENGAANSLLFIKSGGDVGIGTKKPRAKLDINGGLAFSSGVVVNSFSDSVDVAQERNGVVVTETAVKNYIADLFIGSISAFAMEVAPEGWFECNGQALSREKYKKLFARIGTSFGAGDGQNTFNVPDLRGKFVRGWSHGSEADPDKSTRHNHFYGTVGDKVGSLQSYAMESHLHEFVGDPGVSNGEDRDHSHYEQGFSYHTNTWKGGGAASGGYVGWVEGKYTGGASTGHKHAFLPSGKISSPTTGSTTQETRPKNIYLMYCIKF